MNDNMKCALLLKYRVRSQLGVQRAAARTRQIRRSEETSLYRPPTKLASLTVGLFSVILILYHNPTCIDRNCGVGDFSYAVGETLTGDNSLSKPCEFNDCKAIVEEQFNHFYN